MLGQTCTSKDNGYTLMYPTGWHAELAYAGWQCALFDPHPITITPDSEIPLVTVVASVTDFAFNTAVAQYTDPTITSLTSQTGLTIDGHSAVAVEIVMTQGVQALPPGTMRYAVLIEWGARTLIIETDSGVGGDYAIAKHVVLGMAQSLKSTK